jgi:hypothetical protein
MRLDRHSIDAIARAVVSGRRELGSEADRLADAAAGMMQNRLAAIGAPGSRRVRPRRPRPLADQPEVMRRLFDRTAKHLGALAMRGAVGASTRSG